jgi:histidyl-tRNA synthetase
MIFLEEQPKVKKGDKHAKKGSKPSKDTKAQKAVVEKVEYLEHTNVDKATEVAIYYGFTPSSLPTIGKEDKEAVKEFRKHDGLQKEEDFPVTTAEERSAIFRMYEDKSMIALPQPVMLSFNGFVSEGKNRKSTEKKIALEILGSTKSISEAMAIRSSMAILEEYGYENLSVEINSVGDKESVNRFTKEIAAYGRKNINNLSATCRQSFKLDPYSIIHCDCGICSSLTENAPKTMSCLSEVSREHFKEVLEFLEKMEIPYKINHCLTGERHVSSQTVFEIKHQTASGKIETLVKGYRYDGLAKKLGFKKEIPCLSVKMQFKNNIKDKDAVKKIRKARLYFIQLGFEAKHKAISLIETLRQQHILVHQSLSRDKIGSQLILAERMKIPFVIIMGQKEAIDDTVMIRNIKSRSQNTISIRDLTVYIKEQEWF